MSQLRAAMAALDTRMALFTSTPAIDVVWPNKVYTPGASAWLKVDHLPAPTVRRSIGVDGQNAYTGIYQVLVTYPAGGGPGGAESLADAVANWFPVGSVYSGVRIAAVSCAPAITKDPQWHRIPVSVTYELVSTL